MTTKVKSSFTTAGFKKGTRLTTERGQVEVENLRPSDTLLSEKKEFQPVQKMRESQASSFYLLSVHGLEPILLDARAKVYVRDIEFVTEDGSAIPLISWPYWVPVNEVTPTKHLILSPLNPHSLNPYFYLSQEESFISSYIDQEKRRWLQIQAVQKEISEPEVYVIELPEEGGITVNHLAVK